MGEVNVPEKALWGAQTERSHNNFNIGTETMPLPVIRAFAILKKAAAEVNLELGKLPLDKCELIRKACDEIYKGKHDKEFPLKVWQTGSGTRGSAPDSPCRGQERDLPFQYVARCRPSSA